MAANVVARLDYDLLYEERILKHLSRLLTERVQIACLFFDVFYHNWRQLLRYKIDSEIYFI